MLKVFEGYSTSLQKSYFYGKPMENGRQNVF